MGDNPKTGNMRKGAMQANIGIDSPDAFDSKLLSGNDSSLSLTAPSVHESASTKRSKSLECNTWLVTGR
jgi:hypothetical protein